MWPTVGDPVAIRRSESLPATKILSKRRNSKGDLTGALLVRGRLGRGHATTQQRSAHEQRRPAYTVPASSTACYSDAPKRFLPLTVLSAFAPRDFQIRSNAARFGRGRTYGPADTQCGMHGEFVVPTRVVTLRGCQCRSKSATWGLEDIAGHVSTHFVSGSRLSWQLTPHITLILNRKGVSAQAWCCRFVFRPADVAKA